MVGSDSVFAGIRLSAHRFSMSFIGCIFLSVGRRSSSTGGLFLGSSSLFILDGFGVGFFGGFMGGVSGFVGLLCLSSDNVCGLEDLFSMAHGLLGGGEDVLSVAPGVEGGGSFLSGFLKGSDSELVVLISGFTFGEGCLHRVPGELVGLDGGVVGFDSGHPDSVPSLFELSSSNLSLHVREVNADFFVSSRDEGHAFGFEFAHSFLSFTKGTHGIEETCVGVSGSLLLFGLRRSLFLAVAGLDDMPDGITEGFVVTVFHSIGVFVKEFSFSSILDSSFTVAFTSIAFSPFCSALFPFSSIDGSLGELGRI